MLPFSAIKNAISDENHARLCYYACDVAEDMARRGPSGDSLIDALTAWYLLGMPYAWDRVRDAWDDAHAARPEAVPDLMDASLVDVARYLLEHARACAWAITERLPEIVDGYNYDMPDPSKVIRR